MGKLKNKLNSLNAYFSIPVKVTGMILGKLDKEDITKSVLNDSKKKLVLWKILLLRAEELLGKVTNKLTGGC